MVVYVLKDNYGNEIAISKKDIAKEVLESKANPFNSMEKVKEYDGLIIDTYEKFCNAFY